MPEVTTTSTDGSKVTTKWWSNILTPQTVVMIIGGFVAVVLFWEKSAQNFETTRSLEKRVEALEKEKADRPEVDAKIKSVDDKTTRQYEVIRLANERLNQLEKNAEYERGKHEGLELRK